MPIKTRFNLSASSFLDLENMRTALFNVLAAQSLHGTFLLRINDRDKTYEKMSVGTKLQQDLLWLGLAWDEGPGVGGKNAPYYESQRQVIYEKYCQQLLDAQQIYPCFCSPTELLAEIQHQQYAGLPTRYSGKCRELSLDEVTEKYRKGMQATLRFRMPVNEKVEFDDIIKKHHSFSSNDSDDFIIRYANGNIASVLINCIDDVLMEVNLVLQSETYLVKMPQLVLLAKALHLKLPRYGHISLLLKNGQTISTQNKGLNLDELIAKGFMPSAILNYVARLGHNYESAHFMSLAELAVNFSMDNLSYSPAHVEEEQLLHWQKEAIMRTGNDALWMWLNKKTQQLVPLDQRNQFLDCVRPNLLFPENGLFWAGVLFTDNFASSEESIVILKSAGEKFFNMAIEEWSNTNGEYSYWCAALEARLEIDAKSLCQLLRVALTGYTYGPELGSMIKLLGKEKVLKRLRYILLTIEF